MMFNKMGKPLCTLLVMLCVEQVTSEPSIASLRVADLTHAISDKTIYWPGNPAFNFTILAREQQPNYWYEANYFGTAEHGGTHLDAPAHFYKGAYRTQQIPIENLVGPGVIINVKDKAAANPDYRVQVEDLKNWENIYGRIPFGAIVLMNSGWSGKYGNLSQYFGTTAPNDPETFHFPGFHENAADWLVTYRSVNVIGVDTPSVDYGRTKTFPVHVILARDNKSGLENVSNLDRIPENGSMIYAAAIKLYGGSGAPARVFATFYDQENNGEPNGAQKVLSAATLLSFVIVFFAACFT